MTPKTEQIDHNLSLLNFDKIEKAMRAVDWKWKDPKTNEVRIPEKDELRSMAEYCMNMAWESPKNFFSTGGFEAELINGTMEIRFILDRANFLSKLFEK